MYKLDGKDTKKKYFLTFFTSHIKTFCDFSSKILIAPQVTKNK